MSVTLPVGYQGAWPDSPNEREHRKQIARVLNAAQRGKLNCGMDVTLTANAATTDVTDSRISIQTGAFFSPLTAHAAAELAAGTLYVTTANGSLTINHANNAQTDRTFRIALVG